MNIDIRFSAKFSYTFYFLVWKNICKNIYTVNQVSEIMHTNPALVYSLINAGHLPALRLGSYKIRHETLIKFLAEHEGKDLRDPKHIRPICNSDSNPPSDDGHIMLNIDI